jgi:CO/xanthine dehydrogenase FAD-binding subunit
VIPHAESLEVLRPSKLREALSLMDEALREGRPLTPLAGGTDLFVALNAGQLRPARYLDLWAVGGLRGIERDGRTLRFGALATYTDCLRSKAVHKLLPILQEAAREVGGVQIQNRGTLAGNVGNASPAADAVPVLMAAGCVVVLESRERGEREVPLDVYYTGYRQTVRRLDELIVELRVKVPRGPQRFRKVGPRAAQAISKVVMAAVGDRVAFGSVAPTTVVSRSLESYLAGGGRDPEAARRMAIADITPIDDVRSTAEYRRRVAGNLAAEYVEGLKRKED